MNKLGVTTEIWELLQYIFTTPTGSYPGFTAKGIDEDHLVEMLEGIFALAPPRADMEIWDVFTETTRSRASFDSDLSFAQSFIHSQGGWFYNFPKFPNLGIFAYDTRIVFYFYPGPEWTDDAIISYFDFLRDYVIPFSPEVIELNKIETPLYDDDIDKITLAVSKYLNKKPKKILSLFSRKPR